MAALYLVCQLKLNYMETQSLSLLKVYQQVLDIT